MSTSDGDQPGHPAIRPRLSVDDLLAARNTQPIHSLDDLATDSFESDDGWRSSWPSRTRTLLPDVHLAALAREHGVAVVSADTDFAKFDGLRWLNPVTR